MFALRVAALLSLAFVVSASHLEARNMCGNDGLHCCMTESAQNSNILTTLAGTIGVPVDPSVFAGLGCVPIVGSVACTQQTVCCENVSQNGLVNVGCNPINIPL